jgi:hypothetical protein
MRSLVIIIGPGIDGAAVGAFWNGFMGGMLGCVAGLFLRVCIVVIATPMNSPKE